MSRTQAASNTETARTHGPLGLSRTCALMLLLLGPVLPVPSLAQRLSAPLQLAATLPDAPGYASGYASADASGPEQAAEMTGQQATLRGTVLDTNGGVVAGATVTLRSAASAQERVATSDSNGFFSFAAVPPGSYHMTITAKGFANWVGTDLRMQAGQDKDLPIVALPLAATTTNVQVTVSQHQLAAEQVGAQEKQRVLGIVPNFYTSFVWNAAPMSPGQKFQLASRSLIDPLTFVGAAGVAGLEQWRNNFPGYGQGAAGYGKRLGAAYADRALSSLLGDALLPTVLHQDPRYFFKGTGSQSSRVLYAVTRTVITRGDNGRQQPNYSNVLGDFAAAGLGNLYHPAGDRGVGTTVDNALISIGFSALDGLFRELLAPGITTGRPAGGKP